MLRKTIIAFSLFLLSLSVFANTPEKKLTQMLHQFDSLSAKFKQTTYAADGTILQKSRGSLSILRPKKFRWDQSTPTNQIIISNGKTLWIYDPDLSQATKKSLSQSLTQTPLLLLSNKDYMLDKSFTVNQLSSNQYALIPNHPEEAFKKVILQFTNNKISQFQLINNLNQNTVIHFYNVKLNTPISEKLFSFKPPKGVDIISMTNNE